MTLIRCINFLTRVGKNGGVPGVYEQVANNTQPVCQRICHNGISKDFVMHVGILVE